MTDTFFFWGTLRHLPLLRSVLGRDADTRAGSLTGWRACTIAGRDAPVLFADPSAVAPGLLVFGVTAQDRARLDFYAGGYNHGAHRLTVTDADGDQVAAQVFIPTMPLGEPGADWRLDDWVPRWGAVAEATARDVMALFGRKDAAAVAARRAVMQVRGAARARAEAQPAPATLRRAAMPGDVALVDRREPYANFFAVEEYDLSFRRFDGRMSAPIGRTAFVSGDAVVVLPYDLVHDRVLLVEQFRVGAYGRGDANPWSLEGIAGRVDPGETPEESARREAVEEAGVVLGQMLPVYHHYPSPGAKTEFLYTYVALCDLSDEGTRHGGLPGEGEDIRGHVIGFDRMMALVESGEINNGPLVILALWLGRERPRLRGQ